MRVPSAFQGHKVAIVGDSGVGKSTIFAALGGERFSSCYVKTRDREIKTKDVLLENHTYMKMQLWDTPGSDESRTYTTHSIKDVKGVLLVFDVSNEDSYLDVPNWIKIIRTYVEHDDADSVPVIVVANKIDKVRNRKIKEEQVQQISHQYSVQCIETSAKTGHNIERVVQILAEELLKRSKNEETVLPSTVYNPPPQEDSIFRFCSVL